jgi:hypothetical protein
MAFTINGIGTKYVGIRILPDGSYVTTKWVVILHLPIFPVSSIRVVSEDFTFSALSPGFPFNAVPTPLDVRMVLGLYLRAALYGVILIAVIMLLMWISE